MMKFDKSHTTLRHAPLAFYWTDLYAYFSQCDYEFDRNVVVMLEETKLKMTGYYKSATASQVARLQQSEQALIQLAAKELEYDTLSNKPNISRKEHEHMRVVATEIGELRSKAARLRHDSAEFEEIANAAKYYGSFVIKTMEAEAAVVQAMDVLEAEYAASASSTRALTHAVSVVAAAADAVIALRTKLERPQHPGVLIREKAAAAAEAAAIVASFD